jgi:putative chitinase
MTLKDKWKAVQAHLGLAQDGLPYDDTADAVLKALGLHSAIDAKHIISDPAAFFKGIRSVTGPLDQEQVDIINRLLDAGAHWSIGWLAYGLATAWHEARFKPIAEWGKGRGRPYGAVNDTGDAPYGRGLVQLTWHKNYIRADQELGLSGALAQNYDLALRPDIAAAILVRGMEEGWFTSKSLGDYIEGRGTPESFKQARRIINGMDKATLIASHAEKFQDALAAGGWA